EYRPGMHPAQEILGRLLVLGIGHQQVGLWTGVVVLTAGAARDAGVLDVLVHRRALLGLVGVGLLLGLDVDRGAVVGGADGLGEERPVVVGVVPAHPAFVHRLLPERDGILDRLDRLLAVQYHGFAVRLDLLAAP